MHDIRRPDDDRRRLLAGGAALLLGGCAGIGGPAGEGASPTGPRPRPIAHLTPTDSRWLGRVTFGPTPADAARLQILGREAFLHAQLHPPRDDPPALAVAVAALPTMAQDAEARLRAVRAERRRIDGLASDDEKQAARQALNRAGNDAVAETRIRHLLRALLSPAQLREQMTWFWMNHFSVYAGKGNIRWTVADYEERAVRPHALGRFRDLAMATLTSPAMLEYLDNAQSAAQRINENYARELMELHTLGVASGPSGSRYTQQDVQELARVLTGAGIDLNGQPPRLAPDRRGYYRKAGLFEFDPGRHDFGPKTLLGQPIVPSGFPEIEQAVALLCRQPATARFVSLRLARYFVADEPPPALVDRLVATFGHTDGDIAAMLAALFSAPELDAALQPAATSGKFKDPMQFVVSSLRLAWPDRMPANLRPALGWLDQLGEPLYGRVTPDGWPLADAAWTSSGQMVRRFEIARAIGSSPAGLFAGDDGLPLRGGPPPIASGVFRELLEPRLSAATRRVLAAARTPQEWNTALLSAPEWMSR
ncbi:DUF1800 domain-containing protein [uncultured Xylophilus sp.]|uniref:DUF1800 domain-containing protein n=1 Tax=uncultured Xylophilus sp. TaxID=296832 RepID=UPI0025F505AE|nr:DUF1800 domain-containing protein [uncultured Xylophilus sp.]